MLRLDCPSCGTALERQATATGMQWTCASCQGRAAALPVLRRALAGRFADQLWARSQPDHHHPGVRCPSCRRPMRAIAAPAAADGGEPPLIDLCRACQLVWFDAGEYARCPALAPPPAAPAIPAEARRALALAQVDVLASAARPPAETLSAQPPDTWWQTAATLFGLPVIEDDARSTEPPWLTWLLCGLLAAVFVLTWSSSAGAQWGFLPADPWRHGGLTLITAFFLHAGLWHLLGNCWFLAITGDDIETRFGRARLLLLATATLAGHAVHAALESRGDLPCIGASGGIAGVMASYAVAFPQARICLLASRWGWLRLPAWLAFALWVAGQFLLAGRQVGGAGAVSGLAHLGGAAVGLAWGLWWRRVAAPPGPAR